MTRPPSPIHTGPLTHVRRAVSAVALTAAGVLLLGACGSSAGNGTTQPTSVAQSGNGAPQITEPAAGTDTQAGGADSSNGAAARASGGGFAGNRPLASGIIAATQDGSFQVQDSTSQATVNYTGSTDIQRTAAGSADDITVGVCITAVAAADDSGVDQQRSTGRTSGTDAAPRPSTPKELTASTVMIRPSTDGSCSGGTLAGLGGGGFAGGDLPGGDARPSRTGAADMPSSGERPGGNGRSFPGFGGIVSGQVSAVAGSTITVTVTAVRAPTAPSGSDTASSAPTTTATTSTTTSTVTVTGDTTYTTTGPASADSIKVGECATAFGEADDTGAVAATNIELSEAQNGSCSSGIGAGGFGRNGAFPSGLPTDRSGPETTHG